MSDGTLNAGRGLEQGIWFHPDALTKYAYTSFNPTVGQEYTFSLFIRMDDGGAPIPGGSGTDFQIVNNNAGIPFGGYTVEKLGDDGLYRVYAARIADTTSPNFGVLKWASNSGRGFTISGYQIVEGPYPGDYIHTEGFAVDVAAESLQIDHAVLSSIFDGEMPEALTLLIKGTMTRAKEPQDYTNTRLMNWEIDYNSYLDMAVSTYGTHSGKPYFRSRKDGVLSVKSGAEDAYGLGLEAPFAMAFVLTATEIEGFYNGGSTGKVTYGGMANLLSVPLKLFPKGIGTLQEFRIWAETLPSAAMIEATS
ncbi:hypothetical protein [Pseudophaeobacter sp.]|uniref:phage head spike fiber domain-containing protein n=1 Tax=Pseudophaeobacter sp. TaxID=1971739 RepID=UPI0026377BA7|nr:hypothetical protein [Pseudophaeobacter sp.]